jgi:hypothetical protein
MRFSTSARRRDRDALPTTTRGYRRRDFVVGLSWLIPIVETA